MLGLRNADAVAGADVVQQKISDRVEQLPAEGGRNRECAAVDGSPGGGGRERAHVTGRAADLVEQRRPGARRLSLGQQRVARGSLGGTDKAGEAIDVREPGRVWLVV